MDNIMLYTFFAAESYNKMCVELSKESSHAKEPFSHVRVVPTVGAVPVFVCCRQLQVQVC